MNQSLISRYFLLSIIIIFFHQTNAVNQFDAQIAPSIKLSWKIDPPKNIIYVTLEVNGVRGWIGLGWHCVDCKETKMTRADFVVGVFDDVGNVVVSDRFSTNKTGSDGFGAPLMDEVLGGHNDILSFSGFQTTDYTSFSFSRYLVTNDTAADLPITPGSMEVVWAHADITGGKDPNKFGYHGPFAGSATVDFFSGITHQSTSDNLKYYHGSIMTAAFTVCMSFGIFAARYLKQYYWWFYLHIIVQLFGILAAIVGFIIALVMKSGSTHFTNIHSWFGLAVMCLSIVTPSLGWAADLVYNEKRSKVPIWPDKMHWWSGRLTVLLAYVTIILGMRQLGVPEAVQWCYLGVPVAYFAWYGYLEIYRIRNAKRNGDYDVINH